MMSEDWGDFEHYSRWEGWYRAGSVDLYAAWTNPITGEIWEAMYEYRLGFRGV
jgi:hypothetical protein